MYSSRSWAFRSLLFCNSRRAWAMESSNWSGSEPPFLTILLCVETGICVKKKKRRDKIFILLHPTDVRPDRCSVRSQRSGADLSASITYLGGCVERKRAENKMFTTYNGDPNANGQKRWKNSVGNDECRRRHESRRSLLSMCGEVEVRGVDGRCVERCIFTARREIFYYYSGITDIAWICFLSWQKWMCKFSEFFCLNSRFSCSVLCNLKI